MHIRNSEIVSERPERRRYSVSMIKDDDEALEGLKKDLMGVRSSVLFVEGTSSSLDIPLYSQVYSHAKIISKGGSQAVCEAARGISRLIDGHWLEARGLIDRDGRDDSEVASLEKDGIFVLPYPTVENLFFIESAMNCFISADMEYRSGPSREERMDKFRKDTVVSTKAARDDIVANRVSWRIARELSELKPSSRKIKDGFRSSLFVPTIHFCDEVASQVDIIIATESASEILRKLPIKKTTVPASIAKALGADGFKEYVDVIMRRVELAEPEGVDFINAVRLILPDVFGNTNIRLGSA